MLQPPDYGFGIGLGGRIDDGDAVRHYGMDVESPAGLSVAGVAVATGSSVRGYSVAGVESWLWSTTTVSDIAAVPIAGGGVIVAGRESTTWPDSGGEAASLWRLDASGAVVWSTAFAGLSHGTAAKACYAVVYDASTGTLLVGSTVVESPSTVYRILRVSVADGSVIGSYEPAGAPVNTGPRRLASRTDGYFAAVYAGGLNVVVVCDGSGVVQGTRNFGGGGSVAAYWLAAFADAWVYVSVGVAFGTSSTLYGLDDAASIQWSEILSGNYVRFATSRSTGGVLVNQVIASDNLLAEYDSEGDLIGELLSQPDDNPGHIAMALAVGESGDLWGLVSKSGTEVWHADTAGVLQHNWSVSGSPGRIALFYV